LVVLQINLVDDTPESIILQAIRTRWAIILSKKQNMPCSGS